MALTPPTPGLRRLFLNAASAAKVSLSVPPGTVIEATADVAAALVAADPHFHDMPDGVELDQGRVPSGSVRKQAAPAAGLPAPEVSAEPVDEAPKGKKKA